MEEIIAGEILERIDNGRQCRPIGVVVNLAVLNFELKHNPGIGVSRILGILAYIVKPDVLQALDHDWQAQRPRSRWRRSTRRADAVGVCGEGRLEPNGEILNIAGHGADFEET